MSTLNHDGIEFVLPGILKAYPQAWADELVREGNLYFTNLEIFRADENSERGDCFEGTGITIRQGHRCTTGYSNPIFVCCFTMETVKSVILNTWKDRDTVVQVCNTLTFTKRIRDAAIASGKKIHSMQVGPVTYDKDEGSHREYFWGDGIFQKNMRFNGQKEFRFALIGDYCLKHDEHLPLRLGDCSDIVRIVE